MKISLAAPSVTRSAFPFWSGVHFAIVQNALYFGVGLFVNFSLLGYFVVVLSWILGSVFGLNPWFRRFDQTKLSTLSTFIAILFIQWISRHGMEATTFAWVLVEAIAILAGIQAGSFFGGFEKDPALTDVLFVENNGFVLGIVFSIFAFADYGLGFVRVAPAASLLFVFLSPRIALRAFLGGWLVIALTGAPFDLIPLRYSGLLGIALALTWLSPGAERAGGKGESPSSSLIASKWLLFGGGLCLTLLQAMVVRKFSKLISACEISILLVSASFLFGFSVAYYVAPRIRWSQLARFAFPIWGLQVLFLLLGSAIFAQLVSWGLSLPAIFLSFLFLSFCCASLYAVLLPLQIHPGLPLAQAYRWELSGAAVAILVCLFDNYLHVGLVFPLYFVAATAVVWWLVPRDWQRMVAATGAAFSVLLLVAGHRVHEYNLGKYYSMRSRRPVKLLHSSSNFYHQIDVIQDEQGERQAFLNGVRYFGDFGLNEFTYYLAELPAQLKKPKDVLILGAGSLTSIKRVAPYAETITMVEIDPDVALVSEQYFRDQNKIDELQRKGVQYRIQFDDARHFLRTTDAQFDLVVFDISAPYYLQTASLHTVEFLSLIKSRLREGGVLSISTSGASTRVIGRRLIKTVDAVFPFTQVIHVPKVNGFIYASTGAFPWPTSAVAPAITQVMKSLPEGTSVYGMREIASELERYEPITLGDLSIIFEENTNRILGRFK